MIREMRKYDEEFRIVQGCWNYFPQKLVFFEWRYVDFNGIPERSNYQCKAMSFETIRKAESFINSVVDRLKTKTKYNKEGMKIL